MGFKIKIKNPIKEVVKGVDNFVKQPLKETGNLVTRAVGVGATVATGGTTLLLGSAEAKKILNNKVVDQLTFGLSGDLAGFSSAATRLAGGKSLSNEDRDDAFRFLGKAATIGAAAAVSSAGGAAGAKVSSITAAPLTSYGTGQVIQGAIKKGDIAGVVNAIGGNTFLNQVLPGNNTGDFLTGLLPTGQRPTPPTMAPQPQPSYFADPGWISTNESAPARSSAVPGWAIAALVVGIAFVAARRL